MPVFRCKIFSLMHQEYSELVCRKVLGWIASHLTDIQIFLLPSGSQTLLSAVLHPLYVPQQPFNKTSDLCNRLRSAMKHIV